MRRAASVRVQLKKCGLCSAVHVVALARTVRRRSCACSRHGTNAGFNHGWLGRCVGTGRPLGQAGARLRIPGAPLAAGAGPRRGTGSPGRGAGPRAGWREILGRPQRRSRRCGPWWPRPPRRWPPERALRCACLMPVARATRECRPAPGGQSSTRCRRAIAEGAGPIFAGAGNMPAALRCENGADPPDAAPRRDRGNGRDRRAGGVGAWRALGR